MITTKKEKATLDLTNDPVLSLMLRFCLPILLGNLMQQLYNMVDAALVGQGVSTNALAAVGATGSITFLVIGFVDGMCAGFCIPVAQAFGAGDNNMLKRCVMNIVWLGIFFAVLITAATSFALGWILDVMNFSPDIYSDSYDYLRVIFLGIPATIAYNAQAGLMRAMGNSRTPLIILLIASVINIVLDCVFIFVVGNGVQGAAIATIISQIVSAVICFIYIRRHYPILRANAEERRLNGTISKRLLLSGLPMALQYSITAIGSVLVQTAVNGLGTDIVASITAAHKVQSFVHLPFSTLGVTISTWCGQNIGAGKYERMKKGFWCAMLIAVAYSIGIGFIMYFFGEYISLIFINREDPRLDVLLSYVRTYLHINSMLYVPLGVLNICRFALQGMERGITAMFAGFFEMFARSLVALAFVDRYGFLAACFADAAAWIAACLLLIPACIVVFPKMKKTMEQRNAASMAVNSENEGVKNGTD